MNNFGKPPAGAKNLTCFFDVILVQNYSRVHQKMKKFGKYFTYGFYLPYVMLNGYKLGKVDEIDHSRRYLMIYFGQILTLNYCIHMEI